MPRLPHNPGAWPYYMRAETAAAFCDEVSVEAFLRRVGTVYPRPRTISGRGKVWTQEMLTAAIGGPRRSSGDVDAADLL